MSTRRHVVINTPQDRALVSTWAKNVELGTIVEFRKKTRSAEQNAKLHAMLDEVAQQVIWYGRQLDVDDWKNLFTASLRHADVVPGIERGTIVPLGMKTSSMTIEEMSNLIELIYAFGADPAHPVIFKEPKGQNTEPSDDAPSSDAGVDAVPPHHSVDSDIPAQADQPGDTSEASAEVSLDSVDGEEFDEAEWLQGFAKIITRAIGPKEDDFAAVVSGALIGGLSDDTESRAGAIVRLAKTACADTDNRANYLKMIAGKARLEAKELI